MGNQRGSVSLTTVFDKPPRYRSYLLTFWERRNPKAETPEVWRFRLEDPRTGQRRGFTDLAALIAALEQEIASKQMDKAEGRDGCA